MPYAFNALPPTGFLLTSQSTYNFSSQRRLRASVRIFFNTTIYQRRDRKFNNNKDENNKLLLLKQAYHISMQSKWVSEREPLQRTQACRKYARNGYSSYHEP